MDRGPYTIDSMQTVTLGTTTFQEPNSDGGAATSTGSAGSLTAQIRGTVYRPTNRVAPSPVIMIVHGNHGSCDSGTAGATATCTIYKRNDSGYAYMGENLASWGYTVFSLDQDQLMQRQDGDAGKGMHNRRILMAAALDALYAANEPGGIPVSADANIGTTLEGKLDMTRIGMMGHSRGGDAVTNFIDYNRVRPEPLRRYPIRAVIALAPTDYERRAPYDVPFMGVSALCDGDVSNQQAARTFERSQYIKGDDPYPKLLTTIHGANHNWFNTTWFADADDATQTDNACRTATAGNIRLSGSAGTAPNQNYVIDNSVAQGRIFTYCIP